MAGSSEEFLTLDEIVAKLGGAVVGDGKTRVKALGTLESAKSGDIAFLASPKYRNQLAVTQASAVIVGTEHASATDLPRIVTANPYLYFARLSQLLGAAKSGGAGVHRSAVVQPGAQVDPSAEIGALVFVGAGATVGARTRLAPGCVIGERSVVGSDCILYGNVTIYADCQVGDRTILHSGVVIGADGFGIAWGQDHWEKIMQTGRALIGNDVEIGANTTIDRGAIDDTVIEDGVKLDNQIQVGHNVRIGAHTAIAGCTAIAGSARIGPRCRIGGGSGIVGHVEVCEGAVISAFTLITKSIDLPGTYTGGVPFMPHREWLANAAQIRRLDELARRVRELEKTRTG